MPSLYLASIFSAFTVCGKENDREKELYENSLLVKVSFSSFFSSSFSALTVRTFCSTSILKSFFEKPGEANSIVKSFLFSLIFTAGNGCFSFLSNHLLLKKLSSEKNYPIQMELNFRLF